MAELQTVWVLFLLSHYLQPCTENRSPHSLTNPMETLMRFHSYPQHSHTAPGTKLHRVPSSAVCLTGTPDMLCIQPPQSCALSQMGLHTAPWRLLIPGFLHSFARSFSRKPHTGTRHHPYASLPDSPSLFPTWSPPSLLQYFHTLLLTLSILTHVCMSTCTHTHTPTSLYPPEPCTQPGHTQPVQTRMRLH